jgi:hypothetical protein
MVMAKPPSILTAFNDHFIEFVSDIHSVFPDDVDILSAKNAFITIRKMNPKLTLWGWEHHVVSKYRELIDKGDINFFLEKDYFEDVNDRSDSKRIIDAINRLREPVRNMGEENRAKVMIYIQNLTKLMDIYKCGGTPHAP